MVDQEGAERAGKAVVMVALQKCTSALIFTMLHNAWANVQLLRLAPTVALFLDFVRHVRPSWGLS